MSAEMGTLVMWLVLGVIALSGDLIYRAVVRSKKQR